MADSTCPECGATLPADAPAGVCPKCLLAAGLPDAGGFPSLHVRCPHCHNPVEIVDDQPLKEITCPSCDSRFSLIADETVDYRPDTKRTVGRFELEDELGTGAFGTVWRARDPELDRLVAIKIPREGQLSPGESEQFLREARAAGQLQHPNIVSVHEVGRHDGRIYIVSDLVNGVTLADWLTAKQPTPRESAELCSKIAEALHHAHESGVVHRDLKPANIMLDQDGQPHVMDFGLAKREAGEITMTIQGQVLGTPAYMSPEQAKGQSHTADRRSDVYSLGVVLFQLLTGEVPFRGNTQMLLYQITNDDAPSPRKLNSNVPRDLETICLKCLEKEPAQRYLSAAELSDELHRFKTGEAIQARPIGWLSRSGRWCKRNPAIASLMAIIFLSLAIGSGVSTWQWQRAEVALQRTEKAKQEVEDEKDKVEDEKAVSEQARRDLETELGISTAFRLSAESQMAREQFPQRSVLLAVEAVKATNDDAVDPRVVQNLRDALASIGGIGLSGHEGPVTVLAVTPDGKRLVTGSHDNTARVWDLESADPNASALVLNGHNDLITSLAISQDGKRLATGSDDGTVRVWDLESSDPNASAVLLQERNHRITASALSPDGKRLVTRSPDGTVRVWDLESSDPNASAVLLQERNHRITASALSPDGKRLFTVSAGGTVRMWDLESKDPSMSAVLLKKLGPVTYPPDPFGSDPFGTRTLSLDGRRLAVGGADGTVHVWDLESVDPSASAIVLKGHEAAILALSLSPDAGKLFARSGDGTVCVWDLEANDPSDSAVELKGYEGTIYAHSMSQDGKRLATGSDDGTVRVWDLESAELSASAVVLEGHEGYIYALSLSPDGKTLITGSEDRTARVWDLESADPSASAVVLKGHEAEIYALTLSPDGKKLVTGSGDGTARMWDVESTSSSASAIVLGGHDAPIRALALSPNGKRLITSGRSATARVWDLESVDPNASAVELKGRGRRITALELSTDGKRLVTGSNDGTVQVWDLESSDPNASADVLLGHSNAITALALSSNGKRLMTTGADGTVRMWDLESADLSASATVVLGHKHATVLRWHKSSISTLALSADGKKLASGSRDGTARVWDLESADLSASAAVVLEHRHATILHGHKSSISTLALSADGKNLATGSRDGTARVWNLESADPNASVVVFKGHEGPITALALSPDSRRLITGGWDATARVWDLEAVDPNASPVELKGHAEGPIRALVLSADGKLLATGSWDGTARVWDLESADPNASAVVLKGHKGPITALALSPDGKRLITGSEDQTARVWLMKLDDLIAAARKTAGRELTNAERELFRLDRVPR